MRLFEGTRSYDITIFPRNGGSGAKNRNFSVYCVRPRFAAAGVTRKPFSPKKNPYPVLYVREQTAALGCSEENIATHRPKMGKARFSFRWLLNQSMAAAPNPLR